MHLIYGLVEGNARSTETLYHESYLLRDTPVRLLFAHLPHKLCEYESLRCNMHSEVGARIPMGYSRGGQTFPRDTSYLFKQLRSTRCQVTIVPSCSYVNWISINISVLVNNVAYRQTKAFPTMGCYTNLKRCDVCPLPPHKVCPCEPGAPCEIIPQSQADESHLVRDQDSVASSILLKMDKWLKRRKFNDDNSDNDNVRDQVNEPTPEQAQVASYEIAELIAVNLKPHNLAEEIILSACRKIVKTMFGGSADIDICKIPLSNDRIHRRIKDMSEIIEQNTAKTLANSNFALQVDETTDITGNAQLIAFVRFIHENDIINQFLCCRELPDFTTGKHIFQVISSYLEEIKLSWKSCIGICTDGAPAMTGHLKGFVAHVKELNEDILVTHCFLHR
ncbi:zinc finger MYM-type protein 6 [Trichonephila clavipes]|nr:zinc finger MYM-type protein 6 [Trichonephila clavipes]